jgi:hypothetical protein
MHVVIILGDVQVAAAITTFSVDDRAELRPGRGVMRAAAGADGFSSALRYGQHLFAAAAVAVDGNDLAAER